MTELGRHLVVTGFGVEEKEHGWPAAVLELTTRAFDLPGHGRLADRHLAAADRFLVTVVQARPPDLARAFGWPAGEARRWLDELEGRARAVRDGPAYATAGPARKTAARGRR